VNFGADRWIPVGLGAGPLCEVCGDPARWARRLTVTTVDRVPVVSRVWRCDAHAPAATAGRPPCRHRPGPCLVCRDLAAPDRIWSTQPSRIHTTGGCPRRNP